MSPRSSSVAAIVAHHAGSVGMPTPRTQARVVDAQERALPAGVAGDLHIRGDNLFSGYWRRADATADAFTDDGWFRTGDIARIDDDGFLWIVDRRKDMYISYISGGENVYSAEIEAAVAGLAGLAEAAAFGVPDARWREVGHPAIVALPGAAITPEAVLAHLDKRLARYKLPRHVSFREALPRNGAGKDVKMRLREMIAGAVS